MLRESESKNLLDKNNVRGFQFSIQVHDDSTFSLVLKYLDPKSLVGLEHAEF